MAMSERVRRFLRNGIALSVAALVMRTVSVSYGAYISDRVGAEGMGLYSLIMSVYTFAVTLATSGIQLASTRLCAEALGTAGPERIRGALRTCTGYAVGFGALASVLLLLLAAPIGGGLLADARTVPALQVLALSLIPIALSSVYNGYFTAMRRVRRNAVVSVAEQTLRILFTVWALNALMPSGMTYACVALVLGGVIAEIFSCLVMLILYRIDRRRTLRGAGIAAVGFGEIASIAMPVAVSSYVRSGLLSVEHMLIPRALGRGGIPKEKALASYGALTGMAMPIVLYPTAFLSSFAGLLVPEFAENQAGRAFEQNRRLCERSIGASLWFGILCGGILAAFSGALAGLIYDSQEVGRYIALLAPVIPIMYLDHVTDAMLKGIGRQVFSMTVNILDSVGSILLVLLLLPIFGAEGYVYVIVIAEIFNFSLSMVGLHNAVGFSCRFVRWLLFPIAAILFAVALVRCLLGGLGGVPGLLVQILAVCVIYLAVLLLLNRLFPEKEGTKKHR